MLRTFFLLIFTCLFGSLSGQTVTIYGQAPDYAGKELIFYTFPEPISHQPKILAETKIGLDGTFNLGFKTNQSIEIYCDLEKLRGTLVAEPGATYQISLPTYAPRTSQEAASPYFQPELYWLGIKGANPPDLNFLVRAFLTDYNRELATHTIDLYQKKSADSVKAIISRLEKNYPAGKDPYLNALKTYSYGELELIIFQPAKEQIIQKYFAGKNVMLSHPAYQHLFKAIYSDYLTGKSQDFHQKEFIAPALKGDFAGFVHQLTSAGYNLPAAELLACKCFYDGFHDGKFDKNAMTKGLKEATIQVTFEPLKEVLPGIVRKITFLQEGNPAPGLVLINRQNVKLPLRANGKFLYLAFFKSASKECRAELDSLVGMEKKLNTILTVIPISLDENFGDATKFWNEKKYPWELYAAAEPEKVRKDYLLKTVPTFYLISPDQKLVLSQALSPSHNFEALFLKIYRESRFRKQ
ncbi:MAG: hypothetical protein WCP08_00280 [Prolixibacteraceae bacterium]